MFLAEDACNFQRFCPPTLYQGWGLEIAGYFFYSCIIQFSPLCLVLWPQWGSTELQVGTVCFTEAQLMEESWGLPSCFKLLGPFSGACLWGTAEGFALFWDPEQCPVMGLNICAALQAWALLVEDKARLCSGARNTAPSHDNFQVSLFGFQPSAI